MLFDQHCHALRLDVGDLAVFESLATETPHPAGRGSHLDGPVGFAVRRWCAPLIGLDRWCDWTSYLDRRNELGNEEVARTMLAGSESGCLLIDTGYRGDELCDLGEMERLAGVAVHEIVRIERLCERLAGEGSAATLLPRFEQALRASAVDCAGFKSVLAYRCGFDVDLVGGTASQADIDRWMRRGGRMDDPALCAELIRIAARVGGELARPLQFHVGYGDPDVTLHKTNPSLLTPLLEWAQPLGTQIVLLHCWPYQREAGYLATVYPHVWADCGLSMHYSGPSAVEVLAPFFEMTPHTKLLYSSDAFGLAEFYAAGAGQFRWALDSLLDRWLAGAAIGTDEAVQIARNVGHDNAAALYPHVV
jgi:uncharacterized protein